MKRNHARWLILGLYGGMIILLLIGALGGSMLPDTWVAPAALGTAVVLAVAATVIGYKYWRCPHCEGILPRYGIFGGIRCCPYCGENLED